MNIGKEVEIRQVPDRKIAVPEWPKVKPEQRPIEVPNWPVKVPEKVGVNVRL